MKNHPSKTKVFVERKRPGHECEKCGVILTSFSNYKVHCLVHTGVQIYQCNLCDKLCSRENGLKKHLKSHTKVKDLSCPICKREFKQSFNLKRHVALHTTNKIYSTGIGVSTENEEKEEENDENVKNTEENSEKPEEITNNDESKPNPPEKETIQMQEETYTVVCEPKINVQSPIKQENVLFEIPKPNNDQKLSKPVSYELHLIPDTKQLTSHEPIEYSIEEDVVTNEPSFVFDTISHVKEPNTNFYTTSEMIPDMSHANVHIVYEELAPDLNSSFGQEFIAFAPNQTEEKYLISYPNAKEIKKEEPWEHVEQSHFCYICNRRFMSSLILERHLLSHSETNQILLKCRYCNDKYTDHEVFRTHVMSHWPLDPLYFCDFCGKVFIRKSDIKSHLRTHCKVKVRSLTFF